MKENGHLTPRQALSACGGDITSASLCGFYYDGQSSNPIKSRCRIDPTGYLSIDEVLWDAPLLFSTVKISQPLGTAPRYIYFPAGGMFEVRELEQLSLLSQLENSIKPQKSRWLFQLESNIGAIIVAALLTLLFTLGAIGYGVPMTAKLIAQKLPESVYQYLHEDILAYADKFWIKPTELSIKRQEEIRTRFAPVIAEFPDLPIIVNFRRQGDDANAFALPSGDIIFLDGLVSLAANDDELLAVMCHEIAHVYYRHTLQATIQSSLLYFALIMIAGDVTATADLLMSLPTMLTGLSYSRDMETEADEFALALMQKLQIDPIHFANILNKLERHYLSAAEKAHDEEVASINSDINSDSDAQEREKKQQDEEGNFWLDYLSSHPRTANRIERFKQAAQR